MTDHLNTDYLYCAYCSCKVYYRQFLTTDYKLCQQVVDMFFTANNNTHVNELTRAIASQFCATSSYAAISYLHKLCKNK